MKKILILLMVIPFGILVSCQQIDNAFKKGIYQEAGETIPYRYLLPEGYDETKKYPLILILHGAGERGNNNTAQLYDFLVVFQRDSIRKKYPAIVVLPQCPTDQGFQNIPLSGMIVSLQEKFSIDKNRMYVGGLSMGGYGTYDIVVKNPDTFAAAFPICAWWDDMMAISQMTIPDWWLFHGDTDLTIPVSNSYKMSQALKDAGAKEVKLTIYPGIGHNSWDKAFAEPELIPWLFSKSLMEGNLTEQF